MQDGYSRFRLGLFALGTGGLFIALLLFILHNSLDRERATYFILFHDNVKGMVVGSRVNFQGVPIGVVADLRFQDGKTLVELRVDPTRASIQDLTRARMDRLLVTGQVTVELEGYGPAGRSLPPGSFIEPKEDPLHSLTLSLPEVADRATSALVRLDRVLNQAETLFGDANLERVSGLLDQGDRVMRLLADAALPEAVALVAESRVAVRTAADTLPRLEGSLQRLMGEASVAIAGLRGPAIASLGGLRSTLDDVRALARQLRLAPDSLLFGVRPPAAPAGGAR